MENIKKTAIEIDKVCDSIKEVLKEKNMNNFIVTDKDISEAERYFYLDKIKSFTIKNIFKAVLYSILSIGQLYKTQKNIFRLLLNNKLDSPYNILNNLDLFRSVICKTRFSRNIEKYILYLCNNYNKIEQLFFEIISDCNNERKEEYCLREKLIKQIKGFGYKVSSLFLVILGYENVAVIDIWMLRFLRNRGYNINHSEVRKGGLQKNKYLLYEQYLKIEANKYNFSVAFFQCLVWCKLSSWNKQIDEEQLYFDFWNEK